MRFVMNIFIFLSLTLCKSQLIYINVCSDNDCNTNCNSWIATNNKCTPCKDSPCSDNNPSSITTYNSYSIYSDSSCNTLVSNTHPAPLILNDNNCNLLYLYNSGSPNGSYKTLNFSILIGIIVCSFFVILSLFYFFFRFFNFRFFNFCTCCRKKLHSRFEIQNSIFIIDHNHFKDISHGVPLENKKSLVTAPPPLL